MNEKPILFSGEMVRAILDGRKTQTRRVVTQKHLPFLKNILGGFLDGEWNQRPMPYGQVGDRLWVRETWADPNAAKIAVYRADNATAYQSIKWRPSIFMPRWACRLELVVKAVRIERLQDVSEEDARAEGAAIECNYVGRCNSSRCSALHYTNGFRKLWDSINAKRGYGWDSNPWVWVVEFEKAQP